tara:strand:+ start:665 stop:1123 length:459 start_codon:yes stop_codon:yes gene_type:complete
MRILIPILLITSFVFGQVPETGDSIYWSAKYCDTSQSVEDCSNSWVWHAGIGDCIQPSIEFCTAVWPGIWITDTYECCCQVAALPGSDSSWTSFFGSPCQEYLDSINFHYLTLGEYMYKRIKGVYVDVFGRMFNDPPKGMYIKDGVKYLKVD